MQEAARLGRKGQGLGCRVVVKRLGTGTAMGASRFGACLLGHLDFYLPPHVLYVNAATAAPPQFVGLARDTCRASVAVSLLRHVRA